MKIIVAKTAGFCMGVRRAVEITLDASNNDPGPISCYGPLIHNPQVLELLEEKGIAVLDDIPPSGSGTLLIRAHGVPPSTKQELDRVGFSVIDATCPRVIKVQTIIRKHAGQGYATIIIGDDNHPEVIGLLGYAGENGYAVSSLGGLDALPAFEKAIVVAQTTQNLHLFKEVKKTITDKYPHYKIFDTICGSTERRQSEISTLAESVDAVIVVGGRNSGNTQRLVEVAWEAGKTVFHIEEESEIDPVQLDGIGTVGITAGASTPNWIINRVYKKLETLPDENKKTWHSIIVQIQRALILTNLYVALGAGCLTYACTTLLGIEKNLPHILIAFLYVLSMHTFNNLIGKKSDHYNDPDRALFYDKNMIGLAAVGFFSGGAGLAIAITMGAAPFLFLLAVSVMGLLYNITLVPASLAAFRYRRISDIPGSKTILIVVAWGIVTSVFPALSVTGQVTFSTILVFLWTVGVVFVRTVFFDILDMQGDRVVGTKTIPILAGERRTKRLLKTILAVSVFALLFSSAFGLVPPLGIALCTVPVIMALIILAHERGVALPGFRPVFWMETNFILIGIITLMYGL